jgi:hypothetical protein
VPGSPFSPFSLASLADARLAPFAGRALRTYLAALAWIAFVPAHARNPGVSLGPYRAGLSTLACRSMRDLSERGIDELLDLLAQFVFPLTDCDGLGDVIRQIAAALRLWRVRVRDSALQIPEAALDLGRQRRPRAIVPHMHSRALDFRGPSQPVNKKTVPASAQSHLLCLDLRPGLTWPALSML